MKRLLALSLALCGSLAAQELLELPRFVVSSATAEIHLEPDVFGDHASFLDTPRSYTSLDRETLDLSNVTKIGSFQSFDASTQTIGTYGHTATINVRGDMAELYQNGQRRTNNAAGFQPSLNGVERVDIIKGAAPVVFGPGFYSGGYVNFQTKKAESAQYSVGLTLGTLSADHSYFNTTGYFDVTDVIDSKTAYRVSYEGRINDTFYHKQGGIDNSQDIYLTFHKDLDDAKLDIYYQHSWQSSPQIEGINHPSQLLIDSRPISATDNLVSPGDFSNANVDTLQAIYSNKGLRSYTLVEYVDRNRFNHFQYLEWVKQFTADQRIEYHVETDKTYTIAGLQARYEYRESYSNYFNAFFDAYDITVPGVRDATKLPGYFEGTVGPDNRLFFGPLDGNMDTTLSNLYQFAPFFQQRITQGKLELLYGARADAYRVFVTDPLTRVVSDDLTTQSFSRMASLIYKTNDWSAYATYARLYSVNGTVTGGGIVLAPDMRINEENLRSLNKLYEVGLRYDGYIRLGLTGFYQYRQQPDLYAYKPNNIKVRGIELEASHGIGSFYLRSSVTYNEGNFIDSLPFEYAPTVTEPGNYRIPGLSRIYANSSVTYYWNKFAFNLSGRYQTEQSGNTLDTYSIPNQYTLDAAIQYRTKNWSVGINVGNLTNRWNWVHNGDTFGDNAVIHHEALRNVSLTIKIY